MKKGKHRKTVRNPKIIVLPAEWPSKAPVIPIKVPQPAELPNKQTS